MRLFLASEGSDPLTTKKLEEYVGGFSGKGVVYIPTAKNGNGEGRWEASSTWQFLQESGMDTSCLQLEDYKDGLSLDLFKDKDLIWITGGAAGYLMYWIYRTGFDQLLPEVLKRSLYVGSSAGAMISGQSMDICNWYIGETERGASYIPSLKLVDFDIYPHYEENLYDQIKENYKGNKLYLLKNGEEIIVEDDKVKVIGEERVITNNKS
jgi:peptidase E